MYERKSKSTVYTVKKLTVKIQSKLKKTGNKKPSDVKKIVLFQNRIFRDVL